MSTKSSRVLHRTFLACTLFAFLLVPQIEAPGTALAAKPKTKSGPPGKATTDQCLSLALSNIIDSQKMPVSNPPGQIVSFAAVVVLYNNCRTTLTSGATVTAPLSTTCPANSTPGSSPPISASFDPIVDGQTGTAKGLGQTYCTVENNGVPTATILPASATLVIQGSGTDINGKVLRAPTLNLPVTW